MWYSEGKRKENPSSSFVNMVVAGSAKIVGRELVAVGTGVSVGGIGVNVEVGGRGVEAGAHPLNKTVRNTNERKTTPINFFMTLSSFDLIVRTCRRTTKLTCRYGAKPNSGQVQRLVRKQNQITLFTYRKSYPFVRGNDWPDYSRHRNNQVPIPIQTEYWLPQLGKQKRRSKNSNFNKPNINPIAFETS
ncbi:MAG: hypothetical protein C0401_07200 [Anaerolinea sp.]|nr:hypothetical protein [Anaerolinea sp.]